ncbi:MAG TPA: ankyrin repeat domain-containing protein [Flavobacterium sp.]|jgi:ankyrin repeat protein
MKKSIVYLGIALLSLGNVALASNSVNTKSENRTITINRTVTPLCQAVIKGDLETVKKMIEFGSDINEASNGMTPLMFAARYNNVEVIELLLANGANPNIKNDKGFTALKYAQLSNATEAVALLQQKSKSKR